MIGVRRLYATMDRSMILAESEYHSNRITLSTSDITTVKIYFDQEDGIYYVGEDAILKADLENPSAVHSFVWYKVRDRQKNAIDMTTTTKHTGTVHIKDIVNKKLILKIRGCDSSDAGTYILKVVCKDVDIDSNEIHLKIKQGSPEVTLHKVPSVFINEYVKLKATIRGFPKNYRVTWMKSGQHINTTDPKYTGSMVNGDISVLCIRNLENDDNGVYTVRVQNTYGIGQSTEELEVIGVSEMFFMSGPVVVSPKDIITFQLYMSREDHLKTKWLRIKDQSIKELNPDNKKYLYIEKGFQITDAEKEDSATYQFSLNNKKSNKISVYVDDSGKFSNQGNCLRFFALQAVSADAMKKVCNSKFDKFEEIIKKLIDDCKLNKRIPKKKALLLRLKGKEIKSIEDVDISLLVAILKETKIFENPKNGWGNPPEESYIDVPDDMNRIYYYRNHICHSDASNMKTNTFNESVLDLLGAIRRLSGNDASLIKRSCDILNEVFTDAEGIQMMEKLEIFKQEQKTWENLLHHEEFHAVIQNILRSIPYTEVKFHDVYDEGINISENGTRATQVYLYRRYVCFMNRPLRPGDEVHLRGEHIEENLKLHREHAYIKIGLTNWAPFRNSMEGGIAFQVVNCVQELCPGRFFDWFHLHIKVQASNECALKTNLNGTERCIYTFQDVSALRPFWLAINPYGIKSIDISST